MYFVTRYLSPVSNVLCGIVIIFAIAIVIFKKSNKMSVTEIDGSVLEGGGQILRMALALSVLKNKPIRVFNIRGGRSNPGLRAQHLKGLQLVRDISGGTLKGDVIGSTEIVFHPGKIRSGEFIADTQTAGSICLLIQVALPCILFSEDTTTLKLRGGTNAEMAPQFDYTTEVFRPVLERFGATFDYKLIKRGYFPRGGGEVHIRVRPVKGLKAVTFLDFGEVTSIWGWSFVAGAVPFQVAIEMTNAASKLLEGEVPGVEVNIESYEEAPEGVVGSGSGIVIVAKTSSGCILGGSCLGKRGIAPAEVGRKAAQELLSSVKAEACVDSFSQDQIILLMALSDGKSSVKCGPITLHTETAIHVVHLMTEAKLSVVKQGPESNIIVCDGIGR